MLRTADKRLHVGRRLERVIPQYETSTVSDVGLSGTNGTTVTGNASANTKGNYAEVVASTSVDADGFYLSILSPHQADSLLDIAIGGAGSEVNILNNVFLSPLTPAAFISTAYDFYVPLPINAGTRISARVQSGIGSKSAFVICHLAAGGIYELMRCTKVTTFGANTADSGGLSIDASASAGSKAAWHEFSSAISDPISFITMNLGMQGNYGRQDANFVYDIGTGAASSEVVILPNMYCRTNSSFGGAVPLQFQRWCNKIPSGTRLAARVASSTTDTADRRLDAVIYGFTAES